MDTLSHHHPATPNPEITVTDDTTTLPATMRVGSQQRYGTAEVLEVTEMPTPQVAARTVLVETKAAALNPLDWHMMTGTPWMVRLQGGVRTPKQRVRGVDLAGRVVAVGAEVTDFSPGDEVFGFSYAACAQYVAASPDKLVPKPAGATFDEAAGIPVAAITALQGLRDKADLQAGQHVLINGASGGVGLAAIQIAKWMGAEVTAVCSTRNLELVREVGADHVVDYTAQNFTETSTRYDVLFDNQGNQPLGDCRRILTADGVYLLVGGPKKNRAFGPVGRMIRALVSFRLRSQRAAAFVADENKEDMTILAGLVESGELRTIVDETYPLDQIREAMAHLAGGHARGKVIVHPHA